MAQEHQEENSVDPATHSVKRKRGRPRKDDTPGSEAYSRTRRRRVDEEACGNDPFIGQVVSGVLDGKFDAGYMLTVRLGDRGSVLRGVVFEPGLSVPVSAANDIAPNVKMFKRDEISLPSARQLPCFTPIRSRKDGVLRRHQGNESAMSSKGTCQDTVPEDPGVKVPMHFSVDVERLPENGDNYAPGNLKQDFQATVADHASKDGIQNVQSTNAISECPRDIHVPEAGNGTVTALQEDASEDKPVAQLSQTISDSKQAATSDIAYVQEAVGDIELNTQTCQRTDEAKQTFVTSDAWFVSKNDNKTTHLHEVIGDAKPVTEGSQVKTSESKLSVDKSDPGPVFMSSETTEHITDAKLATDAPLPKTSESEQSAKTSDVVPIFETQALDDYGKTLPLTAVLSGQLTERVTKASIPDQADKTFDSGAISKSGTSNEALSSVAVHTSEQKTEAASGAEPVTQISQTKTDKSKQSAEAYDSGPTFTIEACDDYDKVQNPVTVQSSNIVAKKADDLGDASRATGSSVDESAAQHSAKVEMETETIEVTEGMKNSVGQGSRVHLGPLGSESNKPVELSSVSVMDRSLAVGDTPEHLPGDPLTPTPEHLLSDLPSTATSEATNTTFQGADINKSC